MVTGSPSSRHDEQEPSLLVTTQVPAALRRLLEQLTGMLPITGCWATLIVEPPADLRFVAAAEPVARRLQALEAESGSGPSLHAARTGEQVLLRDLDAPEVAGRFPRFVVGAVAMGVAAVYSFPLDAGGQRAGALTMCSDIPVRLDPADLALAQLLTNLAATSITGASQEAQTQALSTAIERHLTESAVFEQAKGRLSVQLGIDTATAGRCLRRYAARTGKPLREVASRVARGTLRVPSSDAIDGESRPAGRHAMVGALRCGIDPALPGRLCLIGEADMNGEDTLRTALDTVSGHGVDVIVDLRALTFLSAGAARVLAQAAVRLPRPRRLLLLDPTWSVARILTLCGIDRLAGVAVLSGEGPGEQSGHAYG